MMVGIKSRDIVEEEPKAEKDKTFGTVSTITTEANQDDDQVKHRATASHGATVDHETTTPLELGDLMAKLDQIDKKLKCSEEDLRVLGRTPIISLNLWERNLWMSFLVVENLDESDQFILDRDFIRNFDVTIDLNNAMFRIRNPDRRYAIKPVNLIMVNENKVPVFLSRRLRLKANEAAIVSLRMKNYNELRDFKQVCIVPNPNSQSAAVLGRSFSITKSSLCVSVLLNTLDIPITIQRGRKLGYALPLKPRFEMTENPKQNEVVDCRNHKDNFSILRRL